MVECIWFSIREPWGGMSQICHKKKQKAQTMNVSNAVNTMLYTCIKHMDIPFEQSNFIADSSLSSLLVSMCAKF